MVKHTVVFMLCVLLCLTMACDLLSPSRDQEAIRVGETGISLETVRRDVETLREEMDLSKDDIRPVFDRLVERLVERYMILAYGRDNGITVSPSDVGAAVRDIKADYPSEKAFRDMLLKRYVDFDVWEEQLRERLLIQKIIDNAMEGVEPVTSLEIRREYDTHRDSYRHPDMIRFCQVVTRTAEEAKEVLTTVRSGIPLSDLIRDKTLCPERAVGMAERWATRDELEATLAEFLFALPSGLAGKPIETPYGYHIVEVMERRPKGVMSLPEVMGDIEKSLLAEKQEAFFLRWVKELQTRYPVKINRGVLNTLEIG